MSWGVSAAVHAALETALPAETEAVTYPPSVIDEMPSASSAPLVPAEAMDVFLPRRRPAVPPPAAPRDDDPGPVDPASYQPAQPAQPAPAPHRPPDLAVLDQVLRGLQRMA
jgi:hypothetical protein